MKQSRNGQYNLQLTYGATHVMYDKTVRGKLQQLGRPNPSRNAHKYETTFITITMSISEISQGMNACH